MCLVLVLVSSSAKAEDLSVSESLKKLPSLRPGIAYDNKTHKVEYLTTAEVLNYKGFSLEGGWVADTDTAVGVISYDLINLKKLGVNVPILDLVDIRPGIWAGFSAIQFSGDTDTRNRYSWGESLTIINVKY